MSENGNININAGSTKRTMAFAVDIFFTNFFKMLLLQIFILNEYNVVKMKSFKINFDQLFGDFSFSTIKDYHIRYFVENEVFNFFADGIFIFCLTGIIYNFLCYLFFNGTIGQRVFSLKLVNIKGEGKASIIKKFTKAIYGPLPFISVFILLAFTFLYLINFHIYAPVNENFSAHIIASVVSVSNPYTAGLAAVFFGLFWYGFYFLNNKKLILGDILSGTKVIDERKKRDIDLLLNKTTAIEDKDFVYYMDKFMNKMNSLKSFCVKTYEKTLEKAKEFKNKMKNKKSKK